MAFPLKLTLETERLNLRPILESDAPALFAYCQSPRVGPDAGWKPHESVEETRVVIRELFFNQENVFGLALRGGEELIGTICLTEDQKRDNTQARMLGYALSEDLWGRGYMTEAAKCVVLYGFNELCLSLISAYCYPHNLRSKRVLEKLGFRYEGTLTDCDRRFDGQVLDSECYILRRESFMAAQNGKPTAPAGTEERN